MSKGSAPRPISVPQAEYDRRWDETFGRKPEGYMDTPDCGWPFCSCAVKCEKQEAAHGIGDKTWPKTRK